MKALRGARVWWGASPFKHGGNLGEQHGGNECGCQSLLAADRLFFKGPACHTTSVEERMEGWKDGKMDGRWPAQHALRSLSKFTHLKSYSAYLGGGQE